MEGERKVEPVLRVLQPHVLLFLPSVPLILRPSQLDWKFNSSSQVFELHPDFFQSLEKRVSDHSQAFIIKWINTL